MATLNYATTIAAAYTAGEITALLAQHRVARITTLYADDGHASGLSFTLRTPHGPRDFTLDVNVDGVWALLREDEAAGRFKASRKASGTFSSRAHAERVAWRIVKDWLEAQLALVDARMATLDQVMLPYLVVRADGQTLHAAYTEREQLLIEAAS